MSDFYQHTNFNWKGSVGIAQDANDDSNIVLFYYRPMHNPAKSKEAGAPIFEDTVYVRYHPPAEKYNINDRPATQEHTRRWPRQWAQFQQNKAQTNEGIPIDLLYPEKPAIAATLRASGVHTVEQLAKCEGTALDAIGMGAQQWITYARRFMEDANKGVKSSQLRIELEERDSQIRVLTQTVDQLKAEIARMQASGMGGGAPQLTMEQVLAAVAQQMQRPEFPPAGNAPGKAFDVATAQINAVHPTHEIADAANRKGKRRA